MQQIVPVLVAEDTIYQGSRANPAALLFWRTAAPVISGSPVALRSVTRPSPALFESPFVSVYGVLEAYQQQSITAPPALAGTIGMFRVSYRPPEIEDEYKRVDHQVFFRTQRTYAFTVQYGGFTSYLPDLCDDPWLEWVHPKASDEAAQYPFRQIYPSAAAVRGQQFNLYFGQPPSPRLEPEPDTQRISTHNLILALQLPQTVGQITSCGVIDAYDKGGGNVLFAWGPFGGNPPDSYNVYVNGVFNQNVTIREALVTGLVPASYTPGPPAVLVPPTTYIVTVTAVRAGVELAPSDPKTITVQPTSVILVTSMKRIFPFPNTGLD